MELDNFKVTRGVLSVMTKRKRSRTEPTEVGPGKSVVCAKSGKGINSHASDKFL